MLALPAEIASHFTDMPNPALEPTSTRAYGAVARGSAFCSAWIIFSEQDF
jgi:hypothetical protein